MRLTIDIPDDVHRSLKIEAARRGSTIREIILESLAKNQAAPQPKVKFVRPIIHSNRKDKLELTNEQIYDLIDFP